MFELIFSGREQMQTQDVVPIITAIESSITRAFKRHFDETSSQQSSTKPRPSNSAFRERLINVEPRCPITNTDEDGCQAAHIVPYLVYKANKVHIFLAIVIF